MKTFTRTITPPPIVEEKKLPDHRFGKPHEVEIDTCPELREQISRFIKRLRSAMVVFDPLVSAYDNDKLFIEEINTNPRAFQIASLIRTQFSHGFHRYDLESEGHSSMDIPSDSVLGYAFTHPAETPDFPDFADKDSYYRYRLSLLRSSGYQLAAELPEVDSDGSKRGFPILFFLPTSPYRGPREVYLETEEEKVLARKIYERIRNNPLNTLF